MTLGAGSRCQESTVITFEWDLMGLKEIFETSKDDEKSPLIASSVFGGGKWQLHFYASAARASSCSLYIAAVPTPEEIALGAQTCLSQGGWPREGPQWTRKGPFSFTFEIKSLDGTIPIVARGPYEPMARKEFTSSCSTWGYPQYVRRTEIFGDRAIAKANNGVKIICTMTYPLAPVSVPAQPSAAPTSRPVSPDIIDTMADLFDNPTHSDVVFKFPNRHGPGYQSIYASKKLLARRSEYFKSMFEGGFAESTYSSYLETNLLSPVSPTRLNSRFGASHLKLPARPSVDLDDIDDDDSDADSDYDAPSSDDECDFISRGNMEIELSGPAVPLSDPQRQVTYLQSCDGEDTVRPMTPESVHSDSDESSGDMQPLVKSTARRSMVAPTATSSMQVIIVRDTAYLTYRALLFALYTDDITFGPLASTYHTDRTAANKKDGDFPYSTRREYVQSRLSQPKTEAQRKAPLPCSPKSLYKLADRFDLPQIKRRAFQAIKNSLNPRNVAAELFGTFSSLFPEVRKFELDYLLSHWEEVSHSDTLMYDMNPFHPSSSPITPGFGSRLRPTSARHNRLQQQISTTNQDIFVQLLQSLRPKSRRSMAGTAAGAELGDDDDVQMDAFYS